MVSCPPNYSVFLMPSCLVRKKGGLPLRSYYHEAGCRNDCHQAGLWCHVYINEMEMRVCLSALCNKRLWGDLGISLEERGRYINGLSNTLGLLSYHSSFRVEWSPCLWLYPVVFQQLQKKKKKGSYLLALQCLRKFITQHKGEDLQSCISEVQWYSWALSLK